MSREGFFRLLAVLASVSMLVVPAAHAQGQSQTLLTRHVRDAVAQPRGTIRWAGCPRLRACGFDVVLVLRSHRARTRIASFNISTIPPTPQYRQFGHPAKEFTERFGPRQEDYDVVLRFAAANSLTVVVGRAMPWTCRSRGPWPPSKRPFM